MGPVGPRAASSLRRHARESREKEGSLGLGFGAFRARYKAARPAISPVRKAPAPCVSFPLFSSSRLPPPRSPSRSRRHPARIAYPDTARGDVVEEQFGEPIADPYRWLENDVRQDPQVRDWVTRQNALSSTFLASSPAAPRSARG